jgi:hypothetical protein
VARCGKFEIYLCYQGRRWPPTQFGYSQDDHCRDGHLTTSKSGKTRDGFVSNAWQRDRKRGVVTFKFSLHHPSSHKRLCETAIYVAEVDASTNGQQAFGLPRHRCGLVGSYIARNGKMQVPNQDGRSA